MNYTSPTKADIESFGKIASSIVGEMWQKNRSNILEVMQIHAMQTMIATLEKMKAGIDSTNTLLSSQIKLQVEMTQLMLDTKLTFATAGGTSTTDAKIIAENLAGIRTLIKARNDAMTAALERQNFEGSIKDLLQGIKTAVTELQTSIATSDDRDIPYLDGILKRLNQALEVKISSGTSTAPPQEIGLLDAILKRLNQTLAVDQIAKK